MKSCLGILLVFFTLVAVIGGGALIWYLSNTAEWSRKGAGTGTTTDFPPKALVPIPNSPPKATVPIPGNTPRATIPIPDHTPKATVPIPGNTPKATVPIPKDTQKAVPIR